ncbi:MAG: cobyrinate a,c-diamide synthase, partial [Desulfosalsimonadaceae bacterium]
MPAASPQIKGLVIAAPNSGSGKTTLTLALLAALKARGIPLAPFKVGPDFIDPGHHSRITGTVSRSLDGWMLGREINRKIFAHGCRDADLAVVEGVMGLFDGFSGADEAGSTAQMAKWLNLPVLLVVDAKSMARSFAALVKGFCEFDRELRVAAIAANNVAGGRHLEYLREAMAGYGVPLLGGIPREAGIEIPDRHLGLYTADDHRLSETAIRQLADLVETHIDLDALLAGLPEGKTEAAPSAVPPAPDVRIGVARDKAFCFYYEDNLDCLRQQGCETVFFSPLTDAALPPDLDGLYLGGGYPELFAGQLEANASIRQSIKALAESGMPVYAECGGFMYLCRKLLTRDGTACQMAGVFPFETRMQDRLSALGYREIRLLTDTPLGPAGMIARGHEFHYSK